MKKLLSIVILCVATQQGTSAQRLIERFSFGLKAGGNYSNFYDASFDTEGLQGFHGGLMVNFRLNDNWSIQEDFLYSVHGAKAKTGFSNGKDIELSYLSVPLLVKYHSNIGVYGELGGQANVLIKDAGQTGFDPFADKVDAGVTVGAGYHLRHGLLEGLGIGARYYFGLTDVGKFNSSAIRPDFKSQVAQLSLFYTLGLK